MFFAEITDEMSSETVSDDLETASKHQFTPRVQKNQAVFQLFYVFLAYFRQSDLSSNGLQKQCKTY